MIKKQPLLLMAFGAILFSSAISSSCRPTDSSSANKHVKVAINVPLTGPIAAWSGQFPNGFKMGLEEQCVKYNVDCSVFAEDAEDDAGNPPQAVTIYNKQSLQGFDDYVSVTTGAANAIAPQLDPTQKPNFIAAFDPFITKGSPNRFRIMANSKIEAPLFVQYSAQHQAKKVYILHLNFSYAEDEFGRIVQPALEKAGTTVVRDKFELDQRDFKDIVQKIKAANPDLIVVAGYSFHLQPLLRDLRSANLLKPGHVLASMDFVDLVDGDASIGELRDVIFACPVFDIAGKIPTAAGWRDRFKARFGVRPTYVPAYAYDNATLIVRSYAKFGKVDTASLRQSVPFDGVNGQIQLDNDRDIVATVALAQVNADRSIVEMP